MKMLARSITVLVVLVAAEQPVAAQTARLDAAQKRELRRADLDLRRAFSLIRRRQTDKAVELLDAVEAKLKELPEELNDNPQVKRLREKLQQRRQDVSKQGGAGDGGVSFLRDVAPILVSRCIDCHGDDARGNLRLDSFAGMLKGGANSPLLVRGAPDRSLIVRRVKATQRRQRMPRNGDPLTGKQIEVLSKWIQEGAKFDGEEADVRKPFTDLKVAPKTTPTDVPIPKPTGNETVSFTKDVAPFLVNICGRCHGGNNPRAGLSLETFASLMKGGNNGRVVLPGNLEGSVLWQRVGQQQPTKMPPGQLLITRSNWRNLKKWFEEGNTFDGDDPNQPLRDLLPEDENDITVRLAKMSPDELAQFRRQRAETLWKRVLKSQDPRFVESNNFLIIGNVSAARLRQMSDWAEEFADVLTKTFDVDEAAPLWKGRLTIFVYKERFGYEEFHQIIHSREIPADVVGHSVVTVDGQDAYVCLQDVGDEATREMPDLEANLYDHVGGAFAKRGGRPLPQWIVRGLGLALVDRKLRKNGFVQGQVGVARDLVKTLDTADQLFANGAFSPRGESAVGYTLVRFFMRNPSKFQRLISTLQAGQSFNEAVSTVYGSNINAIAQAYVRQLSAGGR